MNIEKMKRFARELRRHANVDGLKLSQAQNMTARIHGRRDWHHLEREGPDTSRSRDAMVETMARELLQVASTADASKVTAALLPDQTFSFLPKDERWSQTRWSAGDAFLDHERHRQYAARLHALPIGGIMILNGSWAMAPIRSQEQICNDAGVTHLQVRMSDAITPASLAYHVRAEALDTVREIKGTERAIAAAIEAIGDGATTIITVENMEEAVAKAGARTRETIAALVRIVKETGSRAVVVIDDEHTDRAKAEASLRAMPELDGVHVESFDFSAYGANDPEFERYVNAIAARLPMPADPIQGHNLKAFHALSGGMITQVKDAFWRGMEYLAAEGRRIERMNSTALAALAQAMREHYGEHIALDRNPFTELPWKNQGQERDRREKHEREERLKSQIDMLNSLEGFDRANCYDGISEFEACDKLPLLHEPSRSPIEIRRILEAPVHFSEGHYHEGPRWWAIVDGVAFKLRLSTRESGLWKLGIKAPGMSARYHDGAIHFDSNYSQGYIGVDCKTPFLDKSACPLRHREAREVATAISPHVLAVTDPALPRMSPARCRMLRSVLRMAMLASGSVEGSIRLGLGWDTVQIYLSGTKEHYWQEVFVTLSQEIRLAFPDAIGRDTLGSKLMQSSVRWINREGERHEEIAVRKALEDKGLPMALIDAVAALANPALNPVDQTPELRMNQ